MKKLMKTLIVVGVSFALSTGVATARENYSWTKFKSNLDADGIDELIHGSVFVGTFAEDDRRGDPRRDSVAIFAIYGKGITHQCVWYGDQADYALDKRIRRGGTITQANRIRLDEVTVADVGASKPRGGSIPVYDASNGGFKLFIFHKRRWWENHTGRLQRSIPAVTYELCPNFPKASKLGMKINKAQTAKLYTEMMAQHPGVRILRSDLITEDTKVTWERGEAEPPLTRGYWNAFSEHPCFGCNK
ncbi:hypothetical protein WG622_17345 [Cognatishimia sp. D5M38]|uniref:Uncharacterized protein n=1 Tax=Cognatishimia coralii TaxID=3083254 RepID=A0ABU8QKR9_9RHOB